MKESYQKYDWFLESCRFRDGINLAPGSTLELFLG